MAPTVSDQRTRQGPKGRPILIVLAVSLVLLGLYMVGIMFWSGAQSPDHPSQDASRQSTTGGASSSNTSKVPTANPAYPAPAAPSANTPTGAGQPTRP